ncbi:LANO_0G06678g1_1 [Lachancea nothofagi CBS 11611]|uniref:LANO_0G06678g1_1 n=1 Tax=Lachancea nothofagi CBS 11611 TaxID=1266666 RepID=A0A1G4KH79_9SACH|nr:LANO_0G06678g1_1 [Lachancea nothofagi CBS 11611]
MTFESVRRFGKRVSKISMSRTPFGHKKHDKKKAKSAAMNKSVATLIEQAGSDYAKGETDMAIYRLTRVLSSMEKHSALPTTHPPTHIVQPKDFQQASRKAPPAEPEKRIRKLLLHNELDYDYDPWFSQPYTELPTVLKLAKSHGTVIKSGRRVPIASNEHATGMDNTMTDANSQLFEFSDMIERSFNMLSIGESVVGLDEDTTRFEDRAFLRSPGPESIWSKTYY